MFSIVGLALCLCTCSYSAHPLNSGVSDRSFVCVVLTQRLSVNAPYISSHVVDREGDSFIKSYVVHYPNVGLSKVSSCGVMYCYVPDPP